MKDTTLTESLISEPVAKLVEGVTEAYNGATSPSTRRAVKRKIAQLKSRATDLYDDASDVTSVAIRRADRSVRRNPYRSLAIGAGVGFLVGYLMSRSSRD